MEPNEEQVIPVVNEEVRADIIPVKTGGVRVIKRVEGHDEILQQELRKSRVQVKRVKTDRVVDGPQPVRRVGNTVIVPVVTERLRVEKEWVVTEEIQITQLDERETVEQKVRVNEEYAEIEREDEHGNVIPSDLAGEETTSTAPTAHSILTEHDTRSTEDPVGKEALLGKPRSILKDKPSRLKKAP
jgi:stress response protein YsnF